MHSGVLTKDEVLTFLERKADEKLLKKVCWYILFHAENLVFSAYLLSLAKGEEEAERYLEFNKPLLEELRKLNERAGSYEVADRMIELCLKYGIDPF